ncbi:mitochondrial carrier protein CoAc1-like [Tripterygium wilfordii]|uniref:mitochondrial carrier protein CoAc1-like n=1 Tax=Tripterygium wilfordii TaxID=458696 RepID=UPI0018F8484E|nr:mitochondrial carrier protein CoAc1-like [Tripterygium wilfordii]
MGGYSGVGGGNVDGSNENANVYFIDSFPACVKELFAGAIASAIAKTTTAPLERIKILLQTRREGYHSIRVYESLKKLVKHEGVKGLYKGNAAAVLRIVPFSALHYMTYEQYRSWLVNNCPSLGKGPVIDLLAGSASGGTAVLCTYPLDLARTKLAYQVVEQRSSNGTNAVIGIQDALRSVYRKGGVTAFYSGLGPTLVGILPYAGLTLYAYEELKQRIPEDCQNSIGIRLSCGAFARLFGQTITYPLDVVGLFGNAGTKCELKPYNVEYLQRGDFRYKNTVEALSGIIRFHGWRQLYAGLTINYLKVVPSVAIGFTTYDIMKYWLHIAGQ